jgi:hypothetical protein
VLLEEALFSSIVDIMIHMERSEAPSELWKRIQEVSKTFGAKVKPLIDVVERRGDEKQSSTATLVSRQKSCWSLLMPDTDAEA